MSEKKQNLEKLKEQMQGDDSLPLKNGATNLVFGDGNPDAEIMFIGEGPGYWEDMKGIPFVGNAGAFLNYLLATIKMKRDDVFITNVVHHRPPNNRDPEPHELEAYGKYLDSIINIIDPKVIITLGRFSMGKFLPGTMISAVHGKPRDVLFNQKKLLIIPMYHPAAGLRNGNVKLQMVEDFKKIPDIIKKHEGIENNKEDEEEKKDMSKQMNLL